MLNIRNVSLLITSAYALILALIFGLGSGALHTISKLQTISDDLYAHPFLVSTTAMDARAKIDRIRNDMLELGLSRSTGERTRLSNEIDALDEGLRKDFQIIRPAFLGDFNRLDAIDRELDAWKTLREQILALLDEGKPEQVRRLLMGTGESIHNRLSEGNDYVVTFAQHKAREYASNAARASSERVQEIWYLLAGLAALVSALVLAISLRVRNEFRRNKRATEALTESEKKFHLLFDAATDYKLLVTADGHIVDVNQSCHDSLGYPKSEMLNRNLGEFVEPSFVTELPRELARTTENGDSTFEFALRRRDGTAVPVEARARYVRLHGESYCYLAFRDVTERKQYENNLKTCEARYRAVIETSADGFWISDMEGRLVEVNDAYVRLSGYSREELLSMRIPDLEARERPEDTAIHIQNIMRTGHDRFETEHRRKDGSIWPVEIITNYWPEIGGLFFVFAVDITQRKLQEEEQKLSVLVFQNIGEGTIVTDADNHIVAINPAFTRMTGYTAEEVVGRNPSILNSRRHNEEHFHKMWQSLNATGHWQGEIWDRRKDGGLIAFWVTISTIYGDDQQPHRRVALYSDITKKKQSEETIWRQANFDPLTRLPNRRMFREQLDQELKKTLRSGTSLAVLFIDLDRFKEVNDSLGHHVGDELLVEAANRILSCVRETDMVARLGGDEFTVILNSLPSDAHIERVAQAIITRLREPFQLGEELAYISASVGITLYPDDATAAHGLLKNADQAMYAAKNQGRNRFSYFTPELEAKAQNRLQLIGDLHGALEENQFIVHFQPIVDLRSGAIQKAEALLRWQHPKRGLVSPLDFIPLAEETGMINRIGDWVFAESARRAKQWIELTGRDFQVSVNKSPVQLLSKDGSPDTPWLKHLEELGLPAGGIVIEITEGLLLQENEEVLKKLYAFRDAGVEVAIDDFGTGYSALSYLNKFDIDYLKIDKSFVNNLETHGNDLALAEAIIAMAHKLGIKVIAEGIETEGQLALLGSIGCDFGQGYLFAKPMPAEEFEHLLRSSPSFLSRSLRRPADL